jgi:hypothetical protein
LQATEMREAVRDGIVRSLAVVGLVGIALIHLLDLPGTIRRGAGGTGATCRRVRLERLRAGPGRPPALRAGTTDTLCEGRL